ncbi:MAG: hypothetical protein DRJ03_11500 [Chloroflexi bacterium]|nr:MAG: hypothetical protein DRJ03_11500 [Chloroflexota bacterium]
MAIRRIKKSFTGGELDPLMGARLDFTKYKNGCKKLYNMVALASGAATRRPGSKFLYDLTTGPHPPSVTNVGQVMIPVVIDAGTTAQLIMYTATDGEAYVASFVDDVVHYTQLSGDGGNSEIDPSQFTYYNIDYAQYGYDVYIAQPHHAPFYLAGNASATTWHAVVIAFNAIPPEWELEFPETVTFHQQRSVWGGTATWPQMIWCSQTAAPHDMGQEGETAVVSDGFSFNLESNNWDKIVWMQSDKALNVGTLGHEWVVTGLGGSGPITPVVINTNSGGVDAVIQTSIGSKDLKPVSISGALNFVGKYGRNIYEFQYQFSYDKYMASDKSILAGHLTKTDKIRAWAYQRAPNGVLWSVTENGNLLGCTTIPEHKVTAWHHHYLGDSCIDACVTPSWLKKQDLLYVLVLREVDGVQHTMVERLSSIWTDPQEPQPWEEETFSVDYYLDSYTYHNSPGQTVTGLEHLAGREVGIWADGTTHLPRVVSAAGEITLDYDGYERVVVGLQCTSEVRPYLSDVASEEGSIFGQMQRVTALDIDFYKTIGGEIGVSYQEEDGTETETVEDLQFRTNASSMSATIPRYTGVYHTSFMEGNDRKTEYFIRQKYPQPMTIRGIVDTVEVG